MPLPNYDDLCRYALKSQLTGLITTGDQTITGNKTFLGATVLSGNSTPLTITNTEGSKTINLGNAGVFATDLGTKIFIESGNGSTVISRAGTAPSPYGYGIVFGAGGFTTKKGYLTVGNTASPTGLSDATLVWTDRILSGQWRTNQRLLVNETGVVLSGEAATPANLASTGSTLQTNINSLSGYVNSSSSNIMFITGNQTVSGLKNFTTTPQVSGQPVYFLRNIRSFTGNNFTPDANEARVFEYVLTGVAGSTATLNAPINMFNGDNIIIEIQQSPSGSNNMAFNSSYKFPGGVTPSLTLEQNRVDIYTVLRIGSNFYSTYVKDFSN